MSKQHPEEIIEQARQRITARRQQEQAAQVSEQATRFEEERPWRTIWVTLLAVLLLLLLFIPGATLDWKLYAVVHGLVAQQHNVFIEGRQLPICARNIGIYSSFLITGTYLFLRGRGRAGALPTRPLLALLVVFVLAMAVDGFNSLFGDLGRQQLYTPQNPLRSITGAVMGLAMTTAILLVFNRTLRADVDRSLPVLTWMDLGGALVLNGLMVAAVYSNIGLFYWPLAWLSFLGIVGELYAINVLVISTFMGYSRSITGLAQLARPASFAFFTNLAIIGGLSLLRFWQEGRL